MKKAKEILTEIFNKLLYGENNTITYDEWAGGNDAKMVGFLKNYSGNYTLNDTIFTVEYSPSGGAGMGAYGSRVTVSISPFIVKLQNFMDGNQKVDENRLASKILNAIQARSKISLINTGDITTVLTDSLPCWIKTRVNGVSASMAGCEYGNNDMISLLDEWIELPPKVFTIKQNLIFKSSNVNTGARCKIRSDKGILLGEFNVLSEKIVFEYTSLTNKNKLTISLSGPDIEDIVVDVSSANGRTANIFPLLKKKDLDSRDNQESNSVADACAITVSDLIEKLSELDGNLPIYSINRGSLVPVKNDSITTQEQILLEDKKGGTILVRKSDIGHYKNYSIIGNKKICFIKRGR